VTFEVRRFTVGHYPLGVAIAPDGKHAYVLAISPVQSTVKR
jgi:DNA-binding beta-propeller fold protein YncE